jgi:signal recognition particle subunit SRP54
MVLETLEQSLRGIVHKFVSLGRIDEKAVNELVRDVQRALLQADVNVRLVMDLSTRIKERSLKMKLPKLADPREHIIRIVCEELVNIIGNGADVPLEAQIILMVGLEGSGKTMSTAKLARYFQKKGLRPGVICADTHRPGAYEQLKQLCEEAGIQFYGEEKGDAIEIIKNGLNRIKADVKIVDTAGRHSLEHELIREMEEINEIANPDQKLLVMDAALGQSARNHAEMFDEVIGITGVIITKMDGTAKGGGAISAVSQTGSGITFIGTGETIDDLEPFVPDGFISRLLGMGDIRSLIERAEESLEEEDIESMLTGRFTLRDLYKQLEMIKKLGPLRQVMDLLPFGGMGIDISEDMYELTRGKLDAYKIIMNSMTAEELDKPSTMNASRIKRVAIGSGRGTDDVRDLLRYHKMMKKAMKSLKGGKIPMKLLKKFRL